MADDRPDCTVSAAVEVLPGSRSRSVTASGLVQLTGPFQRLRCLRWDGHVDLDRWWAGEPAVEATLEHRWAKATLTARAERTPGNRWTVRCDARGRGRSWGRLMVAVALVIWHGALVREFRVGGENLQLLDGTPEKKLPPVLTSRQYDLVVLGGATRRSGLAGVLRSLSANLAEAAGGDVLLVNSADGKPVPADSPRSTGDQALDEREQLA